MDPDSYQQAWQAHSSETRLSIDADLLLNEVLRNQRHFRAEIFRRDLVEVGVALLLLPLWLYLGVTLSEPWTWYLSVPVLVWIAGFMLVYRIRHKHPPSKPDEPLLDCVRRSLKEVEDQIWLLRNVFWWYLLPPSISLLAFFGHSSWLLTDDYLDPLRHAYAFVFSFSLYCIFLFALYGFIYYLNQRAVRSCLEPRRQELLTLLASLGDESTAERTMEHSTKSANGTRKFKRSIIIAASCLVTLVLVAVAGGLFESSYDQPAQVEGPAGASLGKLVTHERKEKNLVGLAAMVTVDGQLEAAASDGQRKQGSGVPVEISDQWHLGGITKSISATMIARLVESGQMQWTDTIGKIFPDASVHDDWKPVTLKQLLTDTAGAPANFPIEVRRQWPALGAECTQARRAAVLDVIAEKPAYPPGANFMYSNVGYCIAAAMAEKVTGAAWEDLVTREVFEPLKLTEAGFGPPKSDDKTLQQPRGHRKVLAGKVAENDKADNTPIMGPSGTIHMPLRDLCTYANEHLQGELGTGKLLSAETYKQLHTPELNHYACGWVMKKPSAEISHTVYWHNGSNTLWYALVVFIPEKKMVVAVTANDGDFEQAETAAWEIVKASVNQFNVGAHSSSGATPQPVVYPRKSPFAGVRWKEDKPEVKVGDEWFTLVSLDGIAAGDIVAFSQRTFKSKWQKRFEEDLVELLTRMGHPPQDTVTLVVQSPTSSESRTLEHVPMTEANRRAIFEAAQAREHGEQPPAKPIVAPSSDAAVPLTDLIPNLRKEKKLVGLAAMVMVDGQIVASAVDGERKNGSGVPLEIGDRWHLGSITKSITATMIARLVESGKMQWSDTVDKYFPEATIHEDWKPVTLIQLLTHTGGAPPQFPFLVALKRPALGPKCTQARREAVLNVLAGKPAYPPGEQFIYSNVDYTIAGAMAEKATGATWEDLVKREVFEPLKLTGAGFGPPKSPEETLPQPRGHRPLLGWKVSMDDDADNTAIIGPAGIVHMTLSDLCTFATEHLRGDLGHGTLLSAENFRLLHTPNLDDYACGWVTKKPGADVPYTMYWHNGSNTLWYALVVFIPEKKMVIAVTSNDGDIENAEAAAWEIVKASVKQFNNGTDPPTPRTPADGRLSEEIFLRMCFFVHIARSAGTMRCFRRTFSPSVVSRFRNFAL